MGAAKTSPREDMRCSTCLWWTEADLDDPNFVAEAGQADCRRYPPLIVFGEDTQAEEDEANALFSRWPSTKADEWCGEWQPNSRREEK